MHCGCMQVEAAAHANLNVTRALSGDFLFWPHFHILASEETNFMADVQLGLGYHLTILIKNGFYRRSASQSSEMSTFSQVDRLY